MDRGRIGCKGFVQEREARIASLGAPRRRACGCCGRGARERSGKYAIDICVAGRSLRSAAAGPLSIRCSPRRSRARSERARARAGWRSCQFSSRADRQALREQYLHGVLAPRTALTTRSGRAGAAAANSSAMRVASGALMGEGSGRLLRSPTRSRGARVRGRGSDPRSLRCGR